MQGILLQIRYFEGELWKSFKKITLIFSRTACHPYVTWMSVVCHFIRMSFACYLYAFIFYLYVLACHPYVTRMYSHVIRMSFVCTGILLVCTRISFVCQSHVLVCHPYVTRMWFYHEPSPRDKFYNLKCLILFNHNMPSIIITIFQTESFHLLWNVFP